LELVEIVRPGLSYDVGRNTISDLTEDTNGKTLELASGGWVMSVRNPWLMSVRNDSVRDCFSLFSSATGLAHNETWLCGDLADDLRGGIPWGAGSVGGERGERQS
jgi:hypothetical protein